MKSDVVLVCAHCSVLLFFWCSSIVGDADVGIWTTKKLHQLVDVINNVIEQSESTQTIKEIDAAVRRTIYHPIDPERGFDLHRTVNEFANEFGANEKPRILIPTEMAFFRERTSLHDSKLKRQFASMMQCNEWLEDNLQKMADTLLSRIRYHIREYANKVSDLRLGIAEHRTALFTKMQTTFAEFLDTAEQGTGIIRDMSVNASGCHNQNLSQPTTPSNRPVKRKLFDSSPTIHQKTMKPNAVPNVRKGSCENEKIVNKKQPKSQLSTVHAEELVEKSIGRSLDGNDTTGSKRPAGNKSAFGNGNVPDPQEQPNVQIDEATFEAMREIMRNMFPRGDGPSRNCSQGFDG